MTRQRWDDSDRWIWSEQITHEPLISMEDFESVQSVLVGRRRKQDVPHRPHHTRRSYALRGVLFCGCCSRRMQGNWNNDQAYYRCRYPAEYALANKVDHLKTVYLREAEILSDVDTWLRLTYYPQKH
ncbi:zinc ribbon domain-containing protein [Nonomuraea sp. 3-1Str]|uniref:zinc ribbon domain-containing protein n=1 Tax=Nonomuraea sp. 3-1Str TaxID=2929801 RepID=UPI00286579F2|nr:zinc ribbon domain-containing protein [Nonomuraea sp. 3-1Str]MDR8409489.1 zinc ribbon domain-containing protein [Nonomuraea sp. 3-1Str]